MFFYDSPAGLFTIQLEDGRYTLRLNGEILGRYHAPHAAADDVYTQHTGESTWDNIPLPIDTPTGIDEWDST
ncbi:hypothetical protein [Selenomonas sp. AB3002]|uniref:hypothetical protein n=1 Tax=Selenomonas sp. AB3002 TaxID=1392502 RepID=UPI00068D417C